MLKAQNKKYLGIIKQIALTDFKLKYEGSVLGYLWSLVKPLMLFSILYFVFTQFFKIGNAIPHYPVYLFLGIVMWTFFSELTSMCLGSIVGKQALIRKVYFPRAILIFANSMTSFLTFSLNFVVVAIFMILLSAYPPLKGIVLFPLLIVEYLFLVLGLALLLSSMYVKFRDLTHIWEVVLQFLFYATPMIYPLSIVPPKIAKILVLSPLAQVIQDSRYLLVTTETITAGKLLSPKYIWIPYVIPFVVFFLGVYVFQRTADKFAEEV